MEIFFCFGFWNLIIFLLSFIVTKKLSLKQIKPWLPYFIIGALITTASLLIQYIFINDTSQLRDSNTPEIINNYITYWDFHRNPKNFYEKAYRGTFWGIAICWTVFFFLRNNLLGHSKLFFWNYTFCSILGIISTLMFKFPAETLPVSFLITMPVRLTAISIMLLFPLMVGYLAHYPKNALSMLLLGIYLVLLKLFSTEEELILGLGIGFLLVIFLSQKFNLQRRQPLKLKYMFSIPLLALLWIFQPELIKMGKNLFSPPPLVGSYRNTPLAKVEGLLATSADFYMIQIKTGRPILIDVGALDALPYAPNATTSMHRILKTVYDIDLLNNPQIGIKAGAIPRLQTKELFEARSLLQWQEIMLPFNVSNILTRQDWNLKIPLKYEGLGIRLYHIPNK